MTVEMSTRWEGVLVVEGTPTIDGRTVQQGALELDYDSLPLMGLQGVGDAGHAGANLIGRITAVDRVGRLIIASGDLAEAYPAGTTFGVGADLDRVHYELPDDPETDPSLSITSAWLRGATVYLGEGSQPAWPIAQIVVVAPTPAWMLF